MIVFNLTETDLLAYSDPYMLGVAQHALQAIDENGLAGEIEAADLIAYLANNG